MTLAVGAVRAGRLNAPRSKRVSRRKEGTGIKGRFIQLNEGVTKARTPRSFMIFFKGNY